MHLIITWCGFVGAWVLVAGPVYQGAIELSEVEIDRESIRSHADALGRPERVSPWWWLLPPVAYIKTTRNQSAWRHQMMASLSPEQRVQFLTFSKKAVGWFIVGSGAALIGIAQAAELVETFAWPALVTIPLVAAAGAAALAYTVRRMQLTQRALHSDETASGSLSQEPHDLGPLSALINHDTNSKTPSEMALCRIRAAASWRGGR